MFDLSAGEMLPGPELAAILADADLAALPVDEKLVVAAGYKRIAAWAEAQMLSAVASFATDRDTVPPGHGADDIPGGVRMLRFGGACTPAVEEFAAEEVAVALTVAPTTARCLVGHALDLTHRFPAVHTALARGQVDGFRARVVTEATRQLDSDAAARVEAAILPQLGRVTTRQLEKLVAAEAAAADPVGAEQAEQVAATLKGVWLDASFRGLSHLGAELDAHAGARLEQRVTEVAHLLRMSGCSEPWQHLRADALGMLADPAAVTLLRRRLRQRQSDGGQTDGRRADGQHTGREDAGQQEAGLPQTVLYLHRDPSGRFELDGHGPVTDGHARRILGHSQVVITPVVDLNNVLVASPSYRIPRRLVEAVQIRDRTCRFPGCTRPAHRCQQDHSIAWPRGQTAICNLCCLCTRHHRLKTHTRWQVSQPFNGIFVWRSPTGSIHIVDRSGTTHLDRPGPDPPEFKPPAEQQPRQQLA